MFLLYNNSLKKIFKEFYFFKKRISFRIFLKLINGFLYMWREYLV